MKNLKIAKVDRAKKVTHYGDKPQEFKPLYTNQEYRDGVGSAYRLGIQDGEKRRQQTICAMQAANTHLVAELARLDHDVPLDSVAITMRLAESIQKFLKQVPNARHTRDILMGRIEAESPSECAGPRKGE